MRITADTNLLVRLLVRDDVAQANEAQNVLRGASLIAVPVPVWCELVWVLARGYGLPQQRISAAIEALLQLDGLVTDIAATEAGLAMLRAGGDFADAAIASEGAALGGEIFVSFDRAAVAAWRGLGGRAALPPELEAGRSGDG